MTANPSALGAVLYADEASFAESSSTFDQRLPVVNSVAEMVAGLEQTSEDITRTVQYQNDGHHDIRMIQGGSFDIELMLTGHGSATTGSISATELATFLGRCIGNSAADSAGGTVAASPTDADTFDLSGATFNNGALGRIGTLGDGRGEGQFYRFDDPTTPSDPIVLNSLSGTPNSGDVVYAPELVYPNEGPTAASITTMRFQLLTANQAYNCYGCFPTAIEILGTSAGELLRARVTMQPSAWEVEGSPTFPTSTSTDTFPPAPVAGGSIFINDVGTTTRSTIDAREIEISIDLQNVPLRSPESGRTHQAITGVRRVKCQAGVSFVLDREASGTDTWGDWWNTKADSAAYQHCMISFGSTDGCAVGLYMPKMKRSGPRPTQFDREGLNAHRIEFMAITGNDTDSELERANFVLGLG